MKKCFTEAQVVGFLCEADAGVPIKNLCRKHGFALSLIAVVASSVLAARRKPIPATTAALLAATATIPMIMLIPNVVITLRRGSPTSWFIPLMVAEGMAFVALLISYAVTLFAALPAHAAFQRRNWNRSWHYALLGLALGAARL